ncbi:SURF1 family protein [Aminobacter sp. HY435]|uniref:SURF1 family protein n=1 Tax=Aminobacter sp. HY435 TaxID=2970917 RepID=UPI0022B9788A|nr:SURF1 family protein [Aminobacter sp. HY435]
MNQDNTLQAPVRRTGQLLMLVLGAIAFALLIALGTWQVQRLHWKNGLVEQIAERTQAQPLPLAEMEVKYRATGDVDYWPVTLSGTFLHEGERHFFATWDGQSGFYVYTPLKLDDGRYVLVNRGFVPYDLKDAAKRPTGQVAGSVGITGLARNPLDEKPGALVPDNDLAKNVFYWKERDAMAATAGLPAGATVLPFFVDADKTANPGGLPIGGVTMINMPNNHLQYAVTWYGLAAALLGVMGVWLLRRPDRR